MSNNMEQVPYGAYIDDDDELSAFQHPSAPRADDLAARYIDDDDNFVNSSHAQLPRKRGQRGQDKTPRKRKLLALEVPNLAANDPHRRVKLFRFREKLKKQNELVHAITQPSTDNHEAAVLTRTLPSLAGE